MFATLLHLVFLFKPLDRFFHSDFEIHLRLPIELLKNLLSGNFFARIVAGTSRNVLDPDSAAEHLVDRPGNVAYRNLLRSLEVVDLVLCSIAHRQQMRASQIVYVDIVAILAAVTLNHDRFALESFAYENRYHQLLSHPGSIGNAVSQDGERLLVELPVVVNDHLGGDLAG